MADNYLEWRMEEIRRKGRACETEAQVRRRVRLRREAERRAAEHREAERMAAEHREAEQKTAEARDAEKHPDSGD